MSLLRFVRLAVILFVLGAPRVGFAQAEGPQTMPMPKPGPEHELLKMDAGTWDAAVEVVLGPGAPPMTSKGVEVNTIGCSGLCLITDFKGEMMPGVAFHGHGVTAWDSLKKMYAGSWTDSMSPGMLVSQGTYDPATKKMSGSMEGPDMTGKVVKMRTVSEWPAADSRVMTAYMPGPDGKEVQTMRITYTRRK
ncbi:MAG: DUF1579 domain-containing protein [Acidobacteriota bacterium]|nr:DUF1579 domain-containing protein [Acidobacteriota bacterium]